MEKVISSLFIILFLGIELTEAQVGSIDQNSGSENTTIEWATYETERLSFKYPADWQAVEIFDKDSLGITYAFYGEDIAPVDFDEDNGNMQFALAFFEKMNFSEDRVYSHFKNEIARQVEDYEIILEEEHDFEWFNKMVYTAKYLDIDLHSKKLLYVWVIEPVTYVLIFNNSEGTFEELMPVYEEIFESISYK